MAHLPRSFVASAVKLYVAPKLDYAGLQRQLEQYYKDIRSAEPRMKRANQASIEWLSRQAQKQLIRRIKQTNRRQEEPHNLVRIVGDSSIHSQATGTRFAFFMTDRVDRTPVRRYWRNLETGTNIFVERSQATGRGLIFRTGKSGDNGLPELRAASRTNAFAGSSEVRMTKGPGGALIRNPIPAYRYLDTAVQQYREGNIQRRHLREAFKGTPIQFP